SLTGLDLVALVAVFNACGDVDRRVAELEQARGVGIEYQLVVFQAAGEKRRRAGGPERGIEGVVDAEFEVVFTIGQGKVQEPVGKVTANADGRALVAGVGGDQGQKALRIDLGNVASVECASIETAGIPFAISVAAKRVQLEAAVAQWQSGVVGQREFLDVGVTETMIDAIERQLARIQAAVVQTRELLTRIEAGAV